MLFASFTTLLTTLWVCRYIVLPYNETRTTLTYLEDPVFSVLPFSNFAKVVDNLHNSALTMFLVRMLCYQTAQYIATCMWAYASIVWTRMIFMMVCPLRAHVMLLRLQNSQTNPFDNDLMFSGHTATLVFMGLADPHYRNFYFSLTVWVAFCMLLTRIHYTIDILVAPFVTFTCFTLMFEFLQK